MKWSKLVVWSQPNSIQFNSLQFNSIQFNPIQSNPIQSNPIQSYWQHTNVPPSQSKRPSMSKYTSKYQQILTNKNKYEHPWTSTSEHLWANLSKSEQIRARTNMRKSLPLAVAHSCSYLFNNCSYLFNICCYLLVVFAHSCSYWLTFAQNCSYLLAIAHSC